MPDYIRGTSYAASHVLQLYTEWAQDRLPRETAWENSHDAYNGINTNYWKKKEAEEWRSDYFMMLIKTKVIAAYAIVIDTILQGGKFPFDLEPEEDETGMLYQPDLMKKKIEGQLKDCKADRELMKVVMAMGLYGEGWIKSPVMRTYVKSGFQPVQLAPPHMITPNNSFVRWQPYRKEYDSVACEYRSPWDIFCDREDEDLNEGYGLIDRTMISPYQARAHVGQPFYNKKAILRVIKESYRRSGETKTNQNPFVRTIVNTRKNITKLEFWGKIPKRYITQYSKKNGENSLARDFGFNDSELVGKEINGHAVVMNDELVRLVANELSFIPYHKGVWEMIIDSPDGRGIGDNLAHDQLMVNGIMRATIDNMKLAGNVMLAVKSEGFVEGKLGVFYPGAVKELAQEVENVSQAVQQILINDVSAGLLALFQVVGKNADDNTNLPKIISGETVQQKKAETAFEIDQRMQSAGKYLGAVIRNIDEGIIEPVVQAMYYYNMIQPGYGEEKGNYVVNASGFSSFQNRFLRTQSMKQLLGMVLSHPLLTAEADIRPHLEEIYKGYDLQPEKMLKSEEQKAKDAEAQRKQMTQQMQMIMEERKTAIEKEQATIRKILEEAGLLKAKTETETSKAEENLAQAQLAKAKAGESKIAQLSAVTGKMG